MRVKDEQTADSGENPIGGDLERSTPIIEYLGFLLGEEEYGIPVSQVKEVVRVVDILEVPRVPPFIRGVISLRGTILPVFDIKRRIGFPDAPFSSRTRIIVLSSNGISCCFLADAVFGVIPVDPERIEAPPSGLDLPADFLKGVVHYSGPPHSQDRMLILLNPERVIER